MGTRDGAQYRPQRIVQATRGPERSHIWRSDRPARRRYARHWKAPSPIKSCRDGVAQDRARQCEAPALNRERLIEFGRKRAKQGAGPATLSIDLSFIRTIITHAAAVHGIEVSAEDARLARVALSHLSLVGKSKERDRRPTQDELDELIEYFETNPRQFIPMGRIVRYAVATTLRQEEICKPEWPLVDMKKRLVVIQDRKDPRNKEGNDQKVPGPIVPLRLRHLDHLDRLVREKRATPTEWPKLGRKRPLGTGEIGSGCDLFDW
jgi:integrase